MGIWCFTMVLLLFIGAIRTFSPVPFWDMWDGYIEFFIRAQNGDLWSWFEPYNEHRILLARILFWIDIKFLGGQNLLLITANCICIAAYALVFTSFYRDACRNRKTDESKLILGFVIISWTFLWVQYKNILWGFQIQSLMAQLLPLCAFYWLYRANVDQKRTRDFQIACIFGMASVGTMANGVLAVPLMAVYSVYSRMEKARISVLIVLSAVVISLFAYGHTSPSTQEPLIESILNNSAELLGYAIFYMGNPFYFLVGKGSFGHGFAFVCGLAFIATSLYVGLKIILESKKNPLQLALFFYIIYIGTTVFLTSLGRYNFGIDHGLTSRYATPSLMAWAALFVIFAPKILDAGGIQNRKIFGFLLFLAFIMTPQQIKALRSYDGEHLDKKLSALALELQINDTLQINNIWFKSQIETVQLIAEQASAMNLSVFGSFPLRDLREQFGNSVANTRLPLCDFVINSIDIVSDDPAYMRISGWISPAAEIDRPRLLHMMNGQQQIVGHAITGKEMPNEFAEMSSNAPEQVLVFGGYILSAHRNELALALAGNKQGLLCQGNIGTHVGNR